VREGELRGGSRSSQQRTFDRKGPLASKKEVLLRPGALVGGVVPIREPLEHLLVGKQPIWELLRFWFKNEKDPRRKRVEKGRRLTEKGRLANRSRREAAQC
jgi:hypothetical protein